MFHVKTRSTMEQIRITNTVSTNEKIYEVLKFFKEFGAVTTIDDITLYINYKRLHHLGYTIIYEDNAPCFVKNADLRFIYDAILYFGQTVPLSSLETVALIVIKSFGFSPH